MKRADLSKFIGAGVLSLSMAVLPLTVPASAQTNTDTNTTTDTVPSQDVRTVESDRNFDWGWLGLLGLLGLAGLAGRKNEETTRYRDPDPVSRTGHRE
ncbi:WGxxGxxG family protein [Coleofasciculus sp. FACHB-1120]|uniref:WGxxGxxG family protein n=1 Tax=Coleofasciculus sp. FACHB-1120 TaxID=2692783 RepID=UPI001687BB33|nr:WGxxGxxG family protein [Coleofasciculus sp. FACHB-1120]MBD2743420.1 WGxxGxxG-CTERM domain-containing protein [Coleofasciculus sp. FACHB-1120]